MLDLLMQIDSASAINKDSRDFLIASMSRTRTGAGRIKGLLPRGTPVAHKTGTISGVANDVGYVTLPDGRRFAIAIFTASSDTPLADRDRAVAEVARTLYDYFATSSSNEGADDKEITVKLTVPDLTWTVSIDEIRKVDDELWVISSVSQNPDIMGAQVISTVQASVKVTVPDLPVKYFITGKTWGWENPEPYTFITDLKQIENDITSGESLYPIAQRSTIPELVLNKTWQWESTITPVTKINVPNPERYTILLTDEGRIQARFDCNRGGGSYEISAGKLSFGPLTSTRMACPEDSLDAPFMRDLQRVVSFFVEDGHLYLELPYDSGTMKFRSAP
jgi:heat shock protein HslJ